MQDDALNIFLQEDFTIQYMKGEHLFVIDPQHLPIYATQNMI